MASLKRVRVIKKIQEGGVWRYISLKQNGTRYVWDDRPGTYFVEWWEGVQRRRETAGQTPAEVIAAKRRKQDELRAPQGAPARPEPQPAPAVERPLRNQEPGRAASRWLALRSPWEKNRFSPRHSRAGTLHQNSGHAKSESRAPVPVSPSGEASQTPLSRSHRSGQIAHRVPPGYRLAAGGPLFSWRPAGV